MLLPKRVFFCGHYLHWALFSQAKFCTLLPVDQPQPLPVDFVYLILRISETSKNHYELIYVSKLIYDNNRSRSPLEHSNTALCPNTAEIKKILPHPPDGMPHCVPRVHILIEQREENAVKMKQTECLVSLCRCQIKDTKHEDEFFIRITKSIWHIHWTRILGSIPGHQVGDLNTRDIGLSKEQKPPKDDFLSLMQFTFWWRKRIYSFSYQCVSYEVIG